MIEKKPIIWDMDELIEDFDSDMWQQYKTHDPDKAWLNSFQPALNYRGSKRIVVDFIRVVPSVQHQKLLDPRPKPWAVLLTDKEMLTPKGLTVFEHIKKVGLIQPLKLNKDTMRYYTYEEAYEGSRLLSDQVALNCVKEGISVLDPRTAICVRCEREVEQKIPGTWTDFTEEGRAIVVRERPLEPKDTLIHVCEHWGL